MLREQKPHLDIKDFKIEYEDLILQFNGKILNLHSK